ncbi:polysaccharide transporter, PST family [Alkalibacterium gilvum]|uniref:Polysaccharide transporter, PST family n=1 Tax=Alkalibacterium gilvum TaxID=1130080 RepID=A0A1H6RSG4_9LACT|nr:lipopolysaccharide biosynthesis protein [Alkalibacterium gilvum]SEI54112.1 polysaccharide transporter, PST family [Alkalibacterium gilvum]
MSRSEFKTGIMFSAMGRYGKLVVRTGVNAVLARLLTPTDYGVVAIVNIFLVFFDMLADMGFGPAVIQNKTLDKKDISVIFRFSLYVAVALGLLFSVMGQPVNIFYGADVYVPIFMVLGINVFFYGLMVVPRALLLKQKDFKRVNVVEIIASVINGVVAIILALLGFSYYSIIIGQIVQIVITFIMYYSYTKISLDQKVRKEPITKIWNFARNQFVFNFINYFSRNLDNILIGRYMNGAQLGFYNKSYQISLYPNQLLTGIITPVVQPIMSQYQNNLTVIKDTYLRMVRLLANLGIPLSVFCFFAADNIIFFLFGDQWGQSIPVFRILALSIWQQMIASSTGAFYQSSNRTDLLLLSGIQSMTFNVIGIIYGVYLGSIESVATLVVITFIINFIFNNYLLMYKIFDSNFAELVKTFIKPIILGILQLSVFYFMPDLPFNVFINLVIEGSTFIIVLIVGLLVTGQFKEIKQLIL